MSLDFTTDYANHTLLDNKSKYSKIYKLTEVEASDVSLGDLILLKTPCGQYRLYMATGSADEDNTLHLTRYAEVDFIKAGTNDDTGLVISDSTPCRC
jgi:hypothetical protein